MSSEVTALIRTYNSADTLEECLDTLKAQTLPPKHVIIVDSGSTDETLSIARAYSTEVVHYPDEEFNYSRAINIGMEHVDTSYALIISSHVSIPAPRTLAIMRQLLEQDDTHCAASIWRRAPREEVHTDSVEWEQVNSENFVSRYEGKGISNSCNLIPHSLWQRRPFNEDIPSVEDQEWLKYYLDRDWTAARILQPQLVYKNDRENREKRLRDLIVIASEGINPRLVEFNHIKGRIGSIIHAVRTMNIDKFIFNTRLLIGLISVRMGLEKEYKSVYFKKE